MFCPEIRMAGYTECPKKVCPYYDEPNNVCLRVLETKQNLNILTQKEKAILAKIRKGEC